MKLVQMPIYVTKSQKQYLERLRIQGTTASGYIRSLLERELNQAPATGRKGR